MEPVHGAKNFNVQGQSYDAFMGRYSKPLAAAFVDELCIEKSVAILDVGCGPGALTSELVKRFGATNVSGVDPSPLFVDACAAALPNTDIRAGSAEHLPFDDATFDIALAQLVLHFTTSPQQAAEEMRRVVKPGGLVAASMWETDEGMEMLRAFWDAALTHDPSAPDEARNINFGRKGEIVKLFASAGLDETFEDTLRVKSRYESFDELWAGFMLGIGPAGAYCVSLSPEQQTLIRDSLFQNVGSPSGSFTLTAVARYATARAPK